MIKFFSVSLLEHKKEMSSGGGMDQERNGQNN